MLLDIYQQLNLIKPKAVLYVNAIFFSSISQVPALIPTHADYRNLRRPLQDILNSPIIQMIPNLYNLIANPEKNIVKFDISISIEHFSKNNREL